MNIGEILLGALVPTITTIGQVKLVELLDQFHDKDPEHHKATCQSLWIGLTQLAVLVDKTKTNIDNAVVDALLGAIQQSANKYDIELPA